MEADSGKEPDMPESSQEADGSKEPMPEEHSGEEARESKKGRKKRERREQLAAKYKAGRAERQQAARKRAAAELKGARLKEGRVEPPEEPAGSEAAASEPRTAEEQAQIHERRVARKAAEMAEFREKCAQGTTVLMDLEWEDQMTESELKSLVQQVLYCYGANRKAENPVSMVLSGVKQGSETAKRLAKQAGFESWPIDVSEGAYIDMYSKDRLVYLTADAEDIVEEFDPKKVYIIGGIVDRNRLKGATLLKANEQGIAKAQLPISRHIDMGAYSRVLTVNHVLQIILEFQKCRDWRTALDRGIPGRKKFVEENPGAELSSKTPVAASETHTSTP